MSNLKKDIEGVLRIEFYVNDHDDCDDSCSKKYYADEAFKRATTQIINLIESVIPEEIDVKSKYETDDDGGIIVVVDENNDTMTGENLVHLARLASDEGYNQAIKDIKNKLIGKE